ncbi:MAG TPA: prepilin-type N-terminal cleavage/methylation domain-containing protein [Terriglobales bacterium]|jgi:prepilin-type N-terminal cleavage/methylation domain-containing protein|nr:prepilin-type N-terminal cleavage/methylation domain-containing protein [Terriglobales bacterium]
MRSLETNAGHRKHRASGFSLLEMMIVVAITVTLAVVSVLTLVPLLQAQHVTNAYNATLGALRQARDNAVSQRTSYSVTFAKAVSPSPYATITVAWAPAAGETCLGSNPPCYVPATVTYQYPTDVTFLVPPSGTSAPDSYGTGANAIDFGYTAASSTGGAAAIYFCPDGSAQTSNLCAGAGNWDGGVVYLGRSGNAYSDRAVDLWGGTGRIHGWRLYPASGSTYQWIRQ